MAQSLGPGRIHRLTLFLSLLAPPRFQRSGADQRTHKTGGDHSGETRPSHEQGVDNSHLNLDKTDQKSIANKLDQASKQEKREAQAEEANKKPPTRAAEDVSGAARSGLAF